MNYQLAFITGAGTGLGKELAFQLAQKKVPLFLTSKDPQKLEQVKNELEKLTSIQIFPADLSVEKDVEALLQQIRLTTPDLIINNAGLGLYGKILSFPLEKQRQMIKINIDALVQITIESARALKEKKQSGVIMNISSAASFFIYPSFALYASSKAFVKEFSLSFDLELKNQNIRVLTSLLGRFESDFMYNASSFRRQSSESWDTMNIQKTAQKVLSQIEKKKGYQVIDFRYRLLCFFAKILPRQFLGKRLEKGIQTFLYPL